MKYEFKVPAKYLAQITGLAYPNLKLNAEQRAQFIKKTLASRYNLKPSIDDYVERNSIYVKVERSSGVYTFMMRNSDGIESTRDGQDGVYDMAVEAEDWCYGHKRTSRLHPKRLVRQLYRSSRPVATYNISNIDFFTMLAWLDKNMSVFEYQIFSKFGADFSIGFSNSEAATLFKLAFVGDGV